MFIRVCGVMKNMNFQLTRIAQVSINPTYFYYDCNFYEQTEGTNIGSPLSPVKGNLSRLFQESSFKHDRIEAITADTALLCG